MDGKRKFQRNDSKRIESALAGSSKQTRIKVRAIYPSILKYTGRASGELYIWESGQERIVEVLSEDVPFLIDKRIGGRGCCGAVNQDGNKLFEIVIEEAKNA